MLKFSIICNILPYYSNLHRWKWLLCSLSKSSLSLFQTNYSNFITFGQPYKSDIKINLCPIEFYDFCTLTINLKSKKISERLNEIKGIKEVMKKVKEGEVMVIDDQGRDNLEYVVEIRKEEEDGCRKTNWEQFDAKKAEWIKYVELNVRIWTMVVRRRGGNLEVGKKIGESYYICRNVEGNNDKRNVMNIAYNNCGREDCECRPKKLVAYFGGFKRDIVKEMAEFPYYKNVRFIQIGRTCFRESDIHRIDEIMDKYPNAMFKFMLCWEGVNEHGVEFINTEKVCTFIVRGRILKFKFELEERDAHTLFFTDIIHSKDNSFIALKLKRIRATGITQKYNPIPDLKHQDFIDQLKALTESNDDLYLISDTEKLVLYSNLENIKEEVKYFSLFNRIRISINEYLKVNEAIELLDNIPVHQSYEICIQNDNCFASEEFMNKLKKLEEHLSQAKERVISAERNTGEVKRDIQSTNSNVIQHSE